MNQKEELLWDGPPVARIEIRCTEAEKADIEEVCRRRGGISITRHFLSLHHEDQGRLIAPREQR